MPNAKSASITQVELKTRNRCSIFGGYYLLASLLDVLATIYHSCQAHWSITNMTFGKKSDERHTERYRVCTEWPLYYKACKAYLEEGLVGCLLVDFSQCAHSNPRRLPVIGFQTCLPLLLWSQLKQ